MAMGMQRGAKHSVFAYFRCLYFFKTLSNIGKAQKIMGSLQAACKSLQSFVGWEGTHDQRLKYHPGTAGA
jgi:hypothetical protein